MLVLVEFWLDSAVCVSGHLGGGEGDFCGRGPRAYVLEILRGGREALLGLGGNDGVIFVSLFVDAELLGSLLEVDMDGC